ncbi:MAG: hypothetical protein ACI8QY_000212, partial [bacterium]
MSSNKNTALAEIKSIIDENNISKNDVMSIFNQASTSVWMQILAFVAGLFLVGGLTLAFRNRLTYTDNRVTDTLVVFITFYW